MDPNESDADHLTALMRAFGHGHAEIARLLLEAGADKDLADNSGETALMLSSVLGHAEIARLLLEAGAGKDLANNGARHSDAFVYARPCRDREIADGGRG